jgi:lipoate-protein ligase A
MLDAVEDGGIESALWFWEGRAPFVAIGYGQKVDREVDRAACELLGIPILRRCSGGGAVVQGPGCLSYGLALRMDLDRALATIPAANRWIMERQRKAIAGVVSPGAAVTVRGHTDLVLGERKFSGNAQRRRRFALLFHGTFLLNFNLELMTRLLRFPSAQPEYRSSRPHTEFVVNLHLARERVETAIREEWGAVETIAKLPEAEMEALLASRYQDRNWHLKQ